MFLNAWIRLKLPSSYALYWLSAWHSAEYAGGSVKKHAYICAMWQTCFWQITSTSMTNPIELSPTQVIAMIAQPRYVLMKLITLVSQLEQKPAVTRGSKPHPCGEKTKNPWMPMTFQGDRFCDEFSQEVSNIFCVSSSIYFSKCLPDDLSLLILKVFFSNLYSLLFGGGRIQRLPWTLETLHDVFPLKN